MFQSCKVACAAALWCCVSHSWAANLGEFLDKGAKKISSADQIAKVGKGSTVSGETFSGEARINLTFLPDGTFSGSVTVIKGRYSGEISKSTGTWAVEDDGKFCMKEHLVDWNRYNRYCYYSFELGDQLVLSLSDTDRSAKAMVRPRANVGSDNVAPSTSQ